MKRQNEPANRVQNRISIDFGRREMLDKGRFQAENRDFEGSFEPPPDPPGTGLETK